MKIQVVKTNFGIKPAYNSDYENFKKIPLNEVFEIEYKKKRNIKFHRMFFGLLNLAFENQSLFTNLDDMRYCLLLEAGISEEKVNPITSEIFKVPKSLNFASMDEIEFNLVYSSVKDYICSWLSVTSEQVTEEIEQYF